MIGGILTGLFAETAYAAYDGLTEIPGGWVNRNWVQLGYQIADVSVPLEEIKYCKNDC